MTEKKKYKLHKKLEKVRQLIIIALMIISGLWYVTKGREKDNSAYAFSEQKVSSLEGLIDVDSDEKTKVHEESDSLDDEKTHDPKEVGDSQDAEKTRDLEEELDSHYVDQIENTKESDESIDIETQTSVNSDSSDLINLNHATQKELETLPGVGPATAKNIIDYREKYGGFADIEEIKNVKRIGDKTYEKLKDFITV